MAKVRMPVGLCTQDVLAEHDLVVHQDWVDAGGFLYDALQRTLDELEWPSWRNKVTKRYYVCVPRGKGDSALELAITEGRHI